MKSAVSLKICLTEGSELARGGGTAAAGPSSLVVVVPPRQNHSCSRSPEVLWNSGREVMLSWDWGCHLLPMSDKEPECQQGHEVCQLSRCWLGEPGEAQNQEKLGRMDPHCLFRSLTEVLGIWYWVLGISCALCEWQPWTDQDM